MYGIGNRKNILKNISLEEFQKIYKKNLEYAIRKKGDTTGHISYYESMVIHLYGTIHQEEYVRKYISVLLEYIEK